MRTQVTNQPKDSDTLRNRFGEWKTSTIPQTRPRSRIPAGNRLSSSCSGFIIAGLAFLTLCAGCGNPVVRGTVTPTGNPQVALYTINPQAPATVRVVFGTTTAYGLRTSSRATPVSGVPVGIYVAGMLANTTYHMQAVVQYNDGTTVKDTDHTFQTGSYPAGTVPSVTATTTPGQTPQPGIEIVNTTQSPAGMFAVDLSGNVIWAYEDKQPVGPDWLAPKLLPNGDFVALRSPASSSALKTPFNPSEPNVVREFNLAGDTVKQITMAQLNAELAARGYSLNLLYFSHDVTPLPNGHWIVIANMFKNVVLNGQTTPTQVLGDVIIDLDQDLQPVWVWNEFDHLDVNRHPWNFPDWTHTNAVIYSPDDGDLIVSIRHQNWIVKVNYSNGAGNGAIVWRLGEGGDFKLIGGVDPTDWSYAQHGINLTTPYSAGIFSLAVMDNGDDRMYPGDTTAETCGVNGAPACYSTVPIYQIDESAKTATLEFHQIAPAALYNAWGGDALTLPNGDVEYDLCGLVGNPGSQIFEVTDQPDPQTVWNLTINNRHAYRSYRLPSLYPGVQW